MRWSLRRAEVPAEATGPKHRLPDAPPEVEVEPRGPAGLTPLGSTWSTRAPLTSPATSGLIASDAALLRRTRPTGRFDDRVPAPGRVTGLARIAARPAPPVSSLPSGPSSPPGPAPTSGSDVASPLTAPPLRHAPVRPVVERAPLTQATDAYVGAPTAAAPPPPAPLPAAAPTPSTTTTAQTEAGARFQEALANLHRSGLPRYEGGTETDDLAPPLPPDPPREFKRPHVPPPPPQITGNAAVPGASARDRSIAGPPPAPLTHRRNTLAQSRRLGLGAPVEQVPDAGTGDASAQPADLADALARTRAEYESAMRAAAENAAHAAVDSALDSAVQSAVDSAAQTVATAVPAAVPRSGDDRAHTGADGSRNDDDRGDDDPGSGGRGAAQPLPTVRPLGGARIRPPTSTVPLRFRSAPRQVTAEAAPRTPPRAPVSRPPADLARSLRASHGVDVADVEIRRDSAVGAEADARRARAFTRATVVHLPESAGSVTGGAGRALLAHELIHAAQQRRLGGVLPGEHTTEGQELEREALHAERAYGGAVEPLRHAPKPVTAGYVDDRITQHAVPQVPRAEPPDSLEHTLAERTRWEAAQIAQKIVEEKLASAPGGAAGGLGSAGSGTPGVFRPDIGALHATSATDFVAKLQEKYNLQRLEMGLGPQDLPNKAAIMVQAAEAERLQREKFEKAEKDRLDAEVKSEAMKEAEEDEKTLRRQMRSAGRVEKRTQAAAEMLKQLPSGSTWTLEGGFRGPGQVPVPSATPATGPTGDAIKDAVDKTALGVQVVAGLVAAASQTADQAPTAKTSTDLKKALDQATKSSGDAADKVLGAEKALEEARQPGQGAEVETLKAKSADEYADLIEQKMALATRAGGQAATLSPEDRERLKGVWRSVNQTQVAAAQKSAVTAAEAALTKARESAATALQAELASSARVKSSLGEELTEDEATALANVSAADQAKAAARERARVEAQATLRARDQANAQALATAGVTAGITTPGTAATSTALAAMLAGSSAGTAAVTGPTALDNAHRPAESETPFDPIQPEHMEQLAQRLYERLRSRLRTELLIDRERAGLLTDYR